MDGPSTCLADAMESLQARNDALRIERDHLKAQCINLARDNAGLLDRVRELESQEAARVIVGSQGFQQ